MKNDKDVYVNLKLSPEVRKALKRACLEEELTYSEYLEKVLREKGYWKEDK